MVTPTKFQSFVEALAEKAHNLGSDTLKILLSNDAPSASADALRGDLPSELSGGSGYTAAGHAVTISSSSQTAGTYTLVGTDLVFTSSGTIGPFRYPVLYNDTGTSDPLIQYWDYGSSISLANTETFTVDFGSSILSIT